MHHLFSVSVLLSISARSRRAECWRNKIIYTTLPLLLLLTFPSPAFLSSSPPTPALRQCFFTNMGSSFIGFTGLKAQDNNRWRYENWRIFEVQLSVRFEQHVTQERSIEGLLILMTFFFVPVFLSPSSCHHLQLSRRIKRHTTPAKSDKSLRVTNLKITQVLCQLSEALKEETVRNKKGTWLNTGILSGHDQDTVMTLPQWTHWTNNTEYYQYCSVSEEDATCAAGAGFLTNSHHK